ncbi:hypothetical protein [Nocardioides sp.]|uniref:hypothetical protein n=1 Tax=Nocardioides sp. TaxID=35761 RepID=UPI001A267250|nr:hypothetical protein [Nocardioides sp.]MBJ7355814.1 hypothetical protein [Nocardioides sp.]
MVVVEQAPTKRARHLMDPANPVRQVNDRSLTRVQRTVASVLATTTILHLSAGLIIAAVFIDDEFVAARVGLNLIAGAFAVIAVGVGFAIHGRKPLSPWLLLGLAVAAIGLAFTFS